MTDVQRLAIERLFNTYAKGVGSYVLARVAERQTAENITSRVFLNVVAKIDQCRGSPAAWLWSIVRNEVARYYRDRRPTASLDATVDVRIDPCGTPAEQAADHEMQIRLHLAMNQLNDEQQQLVYMKFFQAMPNTDIAKATGLSAANVGVVVHRAIKRLRELMTSAPGAGYTPDQQGAQA